jgi:transposase
MQKRTSLEDRMRIATMAETGMSDPQIAAQTGWSVHTVRKHRRRAARAGRAGLVSPVGRPVRGPLSTVSTEMRETIRVWRTAHPGWGPDTLRAELARAPRFAGQKIPSRASIARYLKVEGLSRRYEKHRDLPQPTRHPVQAPHECWELDARGYSRVPEVGVISLVNLNDRFSHARLMSYPVWVGNKRCTRHPTTEDYQTVLRLAFTDWGLPQQLQVDHDSVFIDNNSASPFPTRLHLWTLLLGIDLVFSRAGRPTDQAMTERSHQLWAKQCLLGATFADWDQLFHTLRQRRDFLNYHLPCASLNGQPPLVAFPHAMHSGRAYRPEWERDLLDFSRLWDYLAQGRWFRQTSKDFTFSLGRQVYYLGRPWQHTELEITFDPTDQQLVCRDPSGALAARCPIKGLTPDDLMGTLAHHINLPSFQLALPLDWTTAQPVRFYEIFPV